jgi:hypothetical protein
MFNLGRDKRISPELLSITFQPVKYSMAGTAIINIHSCFHSVALRIVCTMSLIRFQRRGELYAIQLAKLSGCKVISTVAPQNHELVQSLGADAVFDHSDSLTARRIFTLTGGALIKAVDCWSQGMSPNQVSMELSPRGGTIATLLPYESRTPNLKTSVVAANTIYGEV